MHLDAGGQLGFTGAAITNLKMTRPELIGLSYTEMCSGSEVGSYLRLIDSCITQLKAQGPSRTCNASKEAEDKGRAPP